MDLSSPAFELLNDVKINSSFLLQKIESYYLSEKYLALISKRGIDSKNKTLLNKRRKLLSPVVMKGG